MEMGALGLANRMSTKWMPIEVARPLPLLFLTATLAEDDAMPIGVPHTPEMAQTEKFHGPTLMMY